MTKEEINSGRKDLVLQMICMGVEIIAIIILSLIFISRFLPFILSKIAQPLFPV